MSLNVASRGQRMSFSAFHGTCHSWQGWCRAGSDQIFLCKLQQLWFFASSTKTGKFDAAMARVDVDSCDCLPDCDATDYQYALTSSSLRWGHLRFWGTLLIRRHWKKIWDDSRSCDSRNLNLEPLCTLESGSSPKLWLNEVICYENHHEVASGWRGIS